MFKDFAMSIIALAFLGTICEMIIPDGSLKKYFKLVMGFIIMIVLIKPVTNNEFSEAYDFKYDAEMSEEELQAQSSAYILKQHEANIKKYILEMLGKEAEVFLEIYSDGAVKSVTIKCDFVSDEVISLLKDNLGCENIRVVNEVE